MEFLILLLLINFAYGGRRAMQNTLNFLGWAFVTVVLAGILLAVGLAASHP